MEDLKVGDCIIILNKEYNGELAYITWVNYYNYYLQKNYTIVEQRIQAEMILNNGGQLIHIDSLIYKR